MSNPKPNVPDNKGKSYKVEPTPMQKQAFDNLLENGGNKADALRKVGYSPAVVNNPQRVTNTKGWKQLEADYFSKDLIAEKINDGLNAVKREFKELVPDHNIRHKFVDTACKIMGAYPKEPKSDVNINVFSLADLAEKSTKRKQMGLPPIEVKPIEEKPIIEAENTTQ